MQLLKIISILTVVLICGCASEYRDTDHQENIAKNIQTEAAQIALLNKKIAASGTLILQNENAMMLLMPAKRFFNAGSENFTPTAYHTLDLIVDLLQYYEKSVVQVSGYADYRDTSNAAQILATARAQNVAQYLWKQDIEASLIYAEGFNATVVHQGKGIITDYVIINFRKLPKY